MLQSWMTPWLLVAIPCAGAAFSLLSWSSLHRMKTWALLGTVASLLASIGLPWVLSESSTALPFLWLLPVAAFLSLLGQPLHQDNRIAWLTTLILLGLGLGILTARGPARHILLAVLFGLLCGVIYRYKADAMPEAWRGIAAYGLGIASILLSLILPSPVSSVAGLLTCAILLPLLPLHGGFFAVVTRLPGNLPAFLALLLPVLGFHSLLLLIASLTSTMFQTLTILALAGACYGSLRALIQTRILPRLAHAGLALFSLLWWYVADQQTAPAPTVVYVGAVSLAMSGLLLAWYAIRARYGDTDLRALGGLAYPMPRFSTVLSLLALAALGMPPFGVFSGFMGMLLTPAFAPSGSLAVIMLVWLSASWYFLDMVHQLVFGRHRPDLRYEDLRQTEFASLLALVFLLLALGIAPSRLFQSNATIPSEAVVIKVSSWMH